MLRNTKDDSKNYHAMAEIDGVKILGSSPEQSDAQFKRIFAKYGATEKIIETFKNGLAKIGVYDKDGKFITQYTDDPKNIGRYTL